APSNPEDERYAPPSTTYFDLRATGDRVVYVLDFSGSMRDPLKGSMLEDLKKLVPAEPPKGGVAGRADVPWADVHNSMQAVAELTKLSIKNLGKDASFCVIAFGTEARTLPATPGLVVATPQNVAAAGRELDALARGQGMGGT